MTSVRLEPAVSWSRVKHSTTEPQSVLHVFRVSDRVRLKPACSATATSHNNEILHEASLTITSQKMNKDCADTQAAWSVPLLFANPEDRLKFWR